MAAGRVGAALFGLVLASAALPWSPAAADTVADKQREAAGLAARIEQLEQTAEELTEDYNQATLDLQQAERDVAEAMAKLGRQETELVALRGLMAHFALRSYVFADERVGLAGLLDETVLGGKAAGRRGYVAVVMGAQVDLTDLLRATLEDSGRQQAELEAKQQRQARLAEAMAGKRTAVDQATANARAALQDVKGDLVELVAAEQQRRLEAAAARQREDIARQQASASSAGSPSRPSSSRAAPAGRRAVPAPVVRPVPPPAPGAAGAVQAAMSQVGNRYVAYAASPEEGFDCSGLTQWAWGQAGVRLPHNSRAQFASLPQVPVEQLQPGDLVFSGSPIHHVGIYIGGGQMVHASTPSTGVVVSPIRSVVGAARP